MTKTEQALVVKLHLTDREDTAHGVTLAEWMQAAGRTTTASMYDLRAAWRAGENPEDYRGSE